MAAAHPLITLLTDFGVDDTYVGQMKGVILGLCPACTVVDLTHAVRPQAVEQGAFLLEGAVGAFPADTIHVAVVDPGVGTARAALALRAGGRIFLGPDNGLLSCALTEAARPNDQPATVAIPTGVEALSIDVAAGQHVAPTFHGRDVFAPAAGRLAAGATFASLGAPVAQMVALPPFLARPRSPDMLEDRVVHVDRFGNVITTIRAQEVAGPIRSVEIGGVRISAFVRTYAEGSGLVALVGSSGYVEVAEVNGNAAARLGIAIGATVRAAII